MVFSGFCQSPPFPFLADVQLVPTGSGAEAVSATKSLGDGDGSALGNKMSVPETALG